MGSTVSRHSPDENSQNDLMDDLESIRKLLEDDEDQVQDPPATNEAAANDIEVPVLEDIFDPDPDLPATEIGATAITPTSNERLMRALLGDTWRDSANKILEQAREVIHERQADLTPEAANWLNDALRSRIDETIRDWMGRIVVAHMAELHERVLADLSEALKATLDDIVKQHSESSDGQ
jgi:hypothetical protein